jgi:hypothetical protein
MDYNEIDYYDAEPLLKLATLENPIISIDRKCKFYGIYHYDKLVSVLGVLEMKNKIRFKNNFTLEEHRGEGFFIQLFLYLLNKYDDVIDAYCTEASIDIYLRNGFILKKKYERKYQNIYWVERGTQWEK